MKHAEKAAAFIEDREQASWHDETVWRARLKRDAAARKVPDWEQLRTLASEIKSHTLAHLRDYLVQFERRAIDNGVHVHWAATAEEHNHIVWEILQERSARRLVKSKSMLTEECGLNAYLERRGVEVVDTDLGERIVQLLGEAPSHIVTPAIHLKKETIGELFSRKLGSPEGESDPTYLTGVARKHLRSRFLRADAALTGVNFAVAETGGFVVCTNEGNADLGVHLAPVHIACMGIEKLIPRTRDLPVFLSLLARSATGQDLTVYTSHFHRPRPGGQLHIVLVDNGRSERLADDALRQSLKCIRCGACMNTCPVYRRSGGHSYGYTIPGPIGSILAPASDGAFNDLPFASSLCGSCSDVCPVRIDLHGQLYAWRQRISAQSESSGKSFLMRASGAVLRRPALYRSVGRLGRLSMRIAPALIARTMFRKWFEARDLPPAPKENFRSWYRRNRRKS